MRGDKETTDDVALASRVARILGSSSAAASALADFERRVAAGEDASIWCLRGTWIVGPRIIAVNRRA